jgi:hypothetical protein
VSEVPAVPASLVTPRSNKWLRRISPGVICVGVLAAGAYIARTSLVLTVARVMLDSDSGLADQERKDGIAIIVSQTSPAWVTPMKNQMNEIWEPAKVQGVNYYTFAGPTTWLRSYSERSNPRSPYYQAWGGEGM